jgi:cytochrome c-type biogenesis protein CcmH
LKSLLAALVLSAAAFAISPDEQLEDPALEARARAISKTLRCIICQSESIDESNASLAKDLRVLVRERLVAGDTDKEVVDYIVDRYGDYVRLSPAVGGRTLLLWGAPIVFLILGAGLVFVVVRQAQRAPLDEEDDLSSGTESHA